MGERQKAESGASSWMRPEAVALYNAARLIHADRCPRCRMGFRCDGISDEDIERAEAALARLTPPGSSEEGSS